MHNLSSVLHSLKTNIDIKERRRQVASMLSRAFSETEIANQLGVNQATISRDIKGLKAESQRFIFDLAREDLAFYYRQSLDGILECKRRAWQIFNDPLISVKERLLTLKIIMQADETKFRLLSDGPGLMAVKTLEQRLQRLEWSRYTTPEHISSERHEKSDNHIRHAYMGRISPHRKKFKSFQAFCAHLN